MTQMLLEIGTGEARPYGARHWIPVALRGIVVKTIADMAEACGTGLVNRRRRAGSPKICRHEFKFHLAFLTSFPFRLRFHLSIVP